MNDDALKKLTTALNSDGLSSVTEAGKDERNTNAEDLTGRVVFNVRYIKDGTIPANWFWTDEKDGTRYALPIDMKIGICVGYRADVNSEWFVKDNACYAVHNVVHADSDILVYNNESGVIIACNSKSVQFSKECGKIERPCLAAQRQQATVVKAIHNQPAYVPPPKKAITILDKIKKFFSDPANAITTLAVAALVAVAVVMLVSIISGDNRHAIQHEEKVIIHEVTEEKIASEPDETQGVSP